MADPRAGPAACELLAKVLSAIQVATGIDAQYGRRLYADVCAFGLVDVGAEGRAVFGRGGGTPDAQFLRLTFTQLRDRILGTGQVSSEELDTLIALFDDPNFVWMGPMGVAVWGRRPIG